MCPGKKIPPPKGSARKRCARANAVYVPSKGIFPGCSMRTVSCLPKAAPKPRCLHVRKGAGSHARSSARLPLHPEHRQAHGALIPTTHTYVQALHEIHLPSTLFERHKQCRAMRATNHPQSAACMLLHQCRLRKAIRRCQVDELTAHTMPRAVCHVLMRWCMHIAVV